MYVCVYTCLDQDSDTLSLSSIGSCMESCPLLTILWENGIELCVRGREGGREGGEGKEGGENLQQH